MTFDWKKFWENFSLEVLLSAILQTGGLWVVHRITGKKLAPPPQTIDPTDPQQIAHAAVYHMTVGPQSGPGKNAVYGALVNDARIADPQRDILDEMRSLPQMLTNNCERWHDFQYSIALIAEKFQPEGEQKAINTLIAIGSEPSAQAAFKKAENEGFLEPSDSRVAHQKMKDFFVGISNNWQEAQQHFAKSSTPGEIKSLRARAQAWATKKL